jgi:hypothetical protein
MAKASTRTSVYELQSRQSGVTLFVTERGFFKLQKISGRIVRTDLRPQITDSTGRAFEHLPGMLMRCIESGEAFQVVEQAPSIRKESI